MNFDTYKREFTEIAIQNGFSSSAIDRCLFYAEKLISNGFPVIYNTTHLSGLVGYKKSYLKRAVVYTSYFYRYFEIRKKNGGKRNIAEPLPSLKEIQHWILKNILYKVPVSKHCKSYVPKIGIRNNAYFHRNQDVVLSIDVKNFFPSITFDSVQNTFLRLGYSNYLSNLFAKLCCLEGCLPQGAPTSPYLSNIFLKDFDDTISNYCVSENIRYTRYADDLTFSGNFDTNRIISIIAIELSKKGLIINEDKLRTARRHQKQIVTGVVVNEKLQAERSYRKNIRQEVHYIKCFGLQNHIKHRKIEKSNYLDHLIGKVNFVLVINPSDEEFIDYRNYLLSI